MRADPPFPESSPVFRLSCFTVFALALGVPLAGQQPPAREPAHLTSAPITDVHYVVSYDTMLAKRRVIHVVMSFSTGSTAPVLLSLPAWSPGHYKLLNFAKNVTHFSAVAGRTALKWHKTDSDTWQVTPASRGTVTVLFDYLADTYEDGNGTSWTAPNFAFISGTNLFMYPEGRSADFPATVSIATLPEWRVTTSMHPAGAPRTFRESNYHDLVDAPVFIGQFDLDSSRVNEKWTRLASYPAGVLQGAPRDSLSRRIARMIGVEAAVFGETPWDSYTAFMVFDSATTGYGALEHQASFLGRFGLDLAKTPDATVAYLSAHEIFHAWNVKRLRPAEMVPYRYDAPQPTPWLWVSEGISDYYADIAMVRAHVIDSTSFIAQITGKIGYVASTSATSLADNSFSAWVGLRDGTDQIYYPKGYLTGLVLDIMIRDASDNHASLDQVMRTLYASTYKQHRGFTASEWWAAVSTAAGGRSFADFASRYVNGSETLPWAEVLPRMGLRYSTDTVQQARFGASMANEDGRQRVTAIVPGGTADHAHVQVGDYLVSVGGVTVVDANWTTSFRAKYDGHHGAPIDVLVRRGADTIPLVGSLATVSTVNPVQFDSNASAKAVRIRTAIMTQP
ncbi:MAG: hypothetical protein ABJE47_17825 [bacterium]